MSFDIKMTKRYLDDFLYMCFVCVCYTFLYVGNKEIYLSMHYDDTKKWNI